MPLCIPFVVRGRGRRQACLTQDSPLARVSFFPLKIRDHDEREDGEYHDPDGGFLGPVLQIRSLCRRTRRA